MSADDLRDRRAPLEMSPEAFREAGHRLVDEVAAFLESLPRRPVTRDEAPSELRALLPAELEDEGVPAGKLLAEAAPLLFDHSLLNGHPILPSNAGSRKTAAKGTSPSCSSATRARSARAP